ncbi:zinc/manganese transport system ATP-binding protein [Rhizobium sp. BK529]|uniref:metal ABC transporter ATP-binding protein n=1 Tax=unclassified Rhizobium TaxID=2613769 RepID=UPI0010488170|nr:MULTISPECIES: metal ABC transporter ATP-binding protein [unclassified Rhizobium]MBB3592214.1 zinc/manganese transport system ATP-binding protein [Rhizobium sp. BK529]TCS06635.1 zinc/manganese transport system ATP-binding protein [Rhizobium sp. BK418]
MSPPEIRLDNLTVSYDRHPAVHHLSGTFRSGSMTAIAGPNGAGKSTLLKAIMGELRPVEGRVEHLMQRTDFGYLPQAAEINRRFPISVVDTVLLGSWRQAGAFGRIAKQDVARAGAALATVGLEGFEKRHIGSLSAGQFQRVLFARLLLQDARIILLDEPFAAIDARTTRDLLDIVVRWHGDGRTVIAVLHDFEQVREYFPETLLLARRLIGWGPTQQVMSSANLLQARAMAERWDEDAEACGVPAT